MYGRVTTIDQAGLVQDSINNAVKWAEDWQMFFNYSKCKHLHIGNHELNFEYFMSTESETFKIQNINSENDLGVIVDRGLKVSEHINKKISKANKILGLIFKSFTFMDKDYKCGLTKILNTVTNISRICLSPYLKFWLDHIWNMPALLGLHYTKKTQLQLKMYSDAPQD